MGMDGDTLWRLVNGIMAGHATLAMAYKMWSVWPKMSARGRLLIQAHTGFLLSLTIGSFENIAQDNPTGFRTALASAAVLWTLIALFGTEPDPFFRTDEHTPGKNGGQNRT